MGNSDAQANNATKDGAERLVRSSRTYVPGIALLLLGATVARALGPLVPALGPLLLSIVAGFLFANLVGVPGWAESGVETHKVWLSAGIVLMGTSLTVDRIVESGPVILLAVVSVTGFTVLYVEALSRNILGATNKLASLLAAGSSICGVSAVVAVAGSIRAREEHVVYAAATILLFDAITLVVYPAIGRQLALSDQLFGIWAGVSMFSTGPAVAVGFAHSETAGQWATLTKLTRNTLIGLVAVSYATYYARRRLGSEEAASNAILWSELWKRFPKFVVGFLALMLVASAGAFSDGQLRSIEHTYNWMFLLAFLGLGTELQLAELRRAGLRPVLVVFVTFVTVSVVSLVVLTQVIG